MALRWGMTWDLFWTGSIGAFWIYRKKYMMEEDDVSKNAWFLGYYHRAAIASVPSFGRKAVPYPKEPIKRKPEYSEEEKKNRAETINKFKKINEMIKRM